MSKFSAKINLLQLHAVVKNIKSQSGEVECIVIPIRQNSLFKGEKGIYLDLQGFELKQKREGSKDTHIIKQSFPKEVYDKLTDEQKKELPILGNAIFWDGSNQETTSSAIVLDDSDLPDFLK